MDVVMKFGEAIKHLDLEADTFFIVLFDSKDPDEMTTISQGDVVKLSAAVAFQTGQLNENAILEMAKNSLNKDEFEKFVYEVKSSSKH